MYYDQLSNGTFLIFSHDKRNKSIPFEGWLHNCVFCNCLTSNYEPFNFNNRKDVKVLTCIECKKTNIEEKFKGEIDIWIEYNIPEIRRRKKCC